MDEFLPNGVARRLGIRARLRSFVFAARGLRWLIAEEHNVWLRFAASILVVVTGVVLGLSAADWRWIVAAMAMVWAAEAFNTAIEHICDRMCRELDPAIGRIKDLAAAGVLLASMAAALIGLLTFGPVIVQRWF